MMLEKEYVLIGIILLVAAVIYYINKGKKGLYQSILYFVGIAEMEFGSKTGQIKYSEVVNYVKLSFPVISLFVREKDLKNEIEFAVTQLKEILENKIKELDENNEETES